MHTMHVEIITLLAADMFAFSITALVFLGTFAKTRRSTLAAFPLRARFNHFAHKFGKRAVCFVRNMQRGMDS
jgi:hypothetical protein